MSTLYSYGSIALAPCIVLQSSTNCGEMRAALSDDLSRLKSGRCCSCVSSMCCRPTGQCCAEWEVTNPASILVVMFLGVAWHLTRVECDFVLNTSLSSPTVATPSWVSAPILVWGELMCGLFNIVVARVHQQDCSVEMIQFTLLESEAICCLRVWLCNINKT